MKKKMIIIISVIIVIAITGYLLMQHFMSTPLYIPGDLTKNEKYSHLLKDYQLKDNSSGFCISEDITLHSFKQGVGEPVLIIHGGPGFPFQKVWKGLDTLASTHKFYYYDQRGCGKSTRPFDKFESNNFYENLVQLHTNLGLPAQIADIEQIRRKLGVEKLTIIGHSFGGFLACLYAIEFPSNVKDLILVTPADVIKMPNGREGLYGIIQKYLPVEMQKEYADYLKRFFDFSSLFENNEEKLVALNSEIMKYFEAATGEPQQDEKGIGGWVLQACFMSMGKEHDYSEQFKTITTPTLMIYGDNDIIAKESLTDYLENIPNLKFVTIENANHFPFETQPEKFGEIISARLNE
jgi:proline iminopeptidase